MTREEIKNVLALSRASLSSSMSLSQSKDEQRVFANIDKILQVAEFLLSECERLKEGIKKIRENNLPRIGRISIILNDMDEDLGKLLEET